MTLEAFQQRAAELGEMLLRLAASPAFYGQVAIILLALAAAFAVIKAVRPLFTRLDASGSIENLPPLLRSLLQAAIALLRPIAMVLALLAGAQIAEAALGDSRVVRLALVAAVIALLLAAIARYVPNRQVKAIARWVGIPLAFIAALGFFDELTVWLDGIAFQAGNIRISVLAILKAALFGGLLFWLGRKSTAAGQKVIRQQEEVDAQTRELAAKALEIVIFCAVGLLLLNILGMDLTALAVFGGALGVGLGFGLQQIASNFISGIIILLERSLKVGDYIEMEDGSAGLLKEINMRSSTLATFDGKEIMLPNDRFITTRFTNWTKTDPLQRYEIRFPIGYEADLRQVPRVIEEAAAMHAGILREPSGPVCELVEFDRRGAVFALQYWVSGMESGPDKFGSEIRFLIWDALKGAGLRLRSADDPELVPGLHAREKRKR